jgi:hypothetical protein
VTLPQLAAKLAQDRQLITALDPFRHDRAPEPPTEIDDRADDRIARAIARQCGDERTVDLQGVEGKMSQVTQR